MDHYLTKKKKQSQFDSPPERHTKSLEASKADSHVEVEPEEEQPEDDIALVEKKEVTPHANVNKNATPYIKDAKTPLYKEFHRNYSICMVVCMLLNTLILIASHVGTSAVIKGSNDPNPTTIDLVGTCTNTADESILTTGSEALEETAVYLGELIEGCSGANDLVICLEERVGDRFGLSFECSQCLAVYGSCLQDSCEAECLENPFDALACDACSDLHCEFELETCSGINFIDDVLADSCVNEKDDLVFTEGSTALTTVTTYLPQVGFSCFTAESQISCVKEGLINLFDISEDCTGCLFNLLTCMEAECLQECLIGEVPKPTCEPCLAATRCESEFESCTGRDFFGDAAPTPEPSTGACDNAEDLAILTPGSEALTQSSVYLPQILGGCVQQVGQQGAAQCTSDAVIARFGLSQECADCTPTYAGCLLATCPDCRPPTFNFEACEDCSNANCELDFEICTGVNFVVDDTEDACVNENDDQVFVNGSEALTTLTTYVPQAGIACFSAESQINCVKENLVDRFSMGEDCSACMFNLLNCMQQECLDECLIGQPPLPDCENCLASTRCEAELETCTGIDFITVENPVLNFCVNPADDLIFVPDSEALNPPIYIRSAALACFGQPDQEACFKSNLDTAFGFTTDCNQCMFEHLQCMSANCRSECIINESPDCEPCLIASPCEVQFESCTGIDFYGATALNDFTGSSLLAPDACINDNDNAIFIDGSFAMQPDFYIPDAALGCIRAGDEREACVKNTLSEQFGFSEGCNDCMYEHLNCMNQRCQSSCIFPGGACEPCLIQTRCERQFERCTGIDFYGGKRLLQEDEPPLSFSEDGQCLTKDQFTIFENVELTFVFSIQKTLDGGSYALAFLLLMASGVWPYTKNILMLVAWFANLSQRQRDILLRILSILGKWSLVDVFAIILIVDGALLQFILSRRQIPFLLFAEPRQGIYWFGIAAVWALVQGEYIRYLEKTHLRQRNIAEAASVVGNLEEKEKKNTIYKSLLAIFSAVSLVFSVIGMFLVNLEMNVIGKITEVNEGPSKYEYNTFQLASALVNSCVLYDEHGSKAGAWFLAGLFVLLVVIIPLVTCVLMYIVAMTFHPSKRDNAFIGNTFGLGNFACLDVWFLSLFVFANQYEGLIAGALGDDAFTCDITTEEIEAGEVCIGLAGETKVGGYMLLIAAVSFWGAQYAAVRLMANSNHFVGTYVEYNTSL